MKSETTSRESAAIPGVLPKNVCQQFLLARRNLEAPHHSVSSYQILPQEISRNLGNAVWAIGGNIGAYPRMCARSFYMLGETWKHLNTLWHLTKFCLKRFHRNFGSDVKEIGGNTKCMTQECTPAISTCLAKPGSAVPFCAIATSSASRTSPELWK